MTGNERPSTRRKLESAAIAALLGCLALLLAIALWSLRSSEAAGLGESVVARVDETGVSSPITAVLMSFRGYDTLLELTVLLVAYAGFRVGSRPVQLAAGSASPVLDVLNQLLVPFLTLFGAYLLWAGSTSSGGAFQAGAVLGAAGLLLALSGRAPRIVPWLARLSIAVGVAVFALVGLGSLAAGGRLLEYPSPYAKALILLIEAAAMWSIAATLVALLIGGMPTTGEDDGPPTR